MSTELAPPFQDLVFMTALSEHHADRLVRFAATDRLVVDVGCGWAELLLRVVAAAPQSRGLGVDLDEAAIVHGRSLARERGLESRVELSIGDAQDAIPPEAASVICIGASQIWSSQVDEGQPLDYRAALRALRQVLPVGRRLVYGECVWTTAPTPAATQALAGVSMSSRRCRKCWTLLSRRASARFRCSKRPRTSGMSSSPAIQPATPRG